MNPVKVVYTLFIIITKNSKAKRERKPLSNREPHIISILLAVQTKLRRFELVPLVRKVLIFVFIYGIDATHM